MEIIRVGVDLAKNLYQVHGVDRKDKPVWRRQLSRQKWLAAIVKKVEPGSEIGIEACAGAHHWAREPLGEISWPMSVYGLLLVCKHFVR